VQAGPLKPKLKSPGTKCLRPNCGMLLLSTSAFKFNLRRYDKYVKVAYHGFQALGTEERLKTYCDTAKVDQFDGSDYAKLAGAYTRPRVSSTSAPFVECTPPLISLS